MTDSLEQIRDINTGRVAWMAAFLAAYAQRINEAPRGSLTFNWDGAELKPDVHIYYPRMKTEGG